MQADLKYHPVAYFLKDIIKELKNLDCETFALSLVDEKYENNKITQELNAKIGLLDNTLALQSDVINKLHDQLNSLADLQKNMLSKILNLLCL